MSQVNLVGIVNCTPDSFSDGGAYKTTADAISYARQCIAEGASIIDVGGDSTRPGSTCVGIEEEWRRIHSVVQTLAKETNVSVDTHHPEIARRALDIGARYINDISGGSREMFQVVRSYSASVVIMYSRCSQPHVFDKEPSTDLIADIKDFFKLQLKIAEHSGLSRNQILFDPGMGAYLSPNLDDSLTVIRSIDKFESFSPLFLGVSRKGFLKILSDVPASERDAASAFFGAEIANKLKPKQLFLRIHNVPLQQQFLDVYEHLQ